MKLKILKLKGVLKSLLKMEKFLRKWSLIIYIICLNVKFGNFKI